MYGYKNFRFEVKLDQITLIQKKSAAFIRDFKSMLFLIVSRCKSVAFVVFAQSASALFLKIIRLASECVNVNSW